jgi:hypothetical protein
MHLSADFFDLLSPMMAVLFPLAGRREMRRSGQRESKRKNCLSPMD